MLPVQFELKRYGKEQLEVNQIFLNVETLVVMKKERLHGKQ